MTDLLPCPFCGSAGDMLWMRGNGADAFWVSCDICECDGPVAAKETEAGAIEGWNTRSSAQPSTEAVKLADSSAWTFRLTDNLDPEERLEEAALWKAMHDEYGDMVIPITGDVSATFGRPNRRNPVERLEYWTDPAFLDHCQRRFSVVPVDYLAAAVGELHEDGLGAFVKSTREKHAIFRVPVGSDPFEEMGAMVYSFIDGGPDLMVQELCEVADEYRFFCIARKLVTFSRNSPELTPLDFPPTYDRHRFKLERPLEDLAATVAANMRTADAVIDVAFINGRPGVVEFNPMHLGGVGLFACDVRALARAARYSAQAIEARREQSDD